MKEHEAVFSTGQNLIFSIVAGVVIDTIQERLCKRHLK